jgi:hypothetical protein
VGNGHLVAGIHPLSVNQDDQKLGLICLPILALRLLTLIQIRIRPSLQQTGEALVGLYAGQPNHITERSIAMRLPKAIQVRNNPDPSSDGSVTYLVSLSIEKLAGSCSRTSLCSTTRLPAFGR